MKYLDFSGNSINDSDKAQVDFIKLMLLTPTGEVFGNPKYGYSSLNLADDDSITNAISDITASMLNNSITVASINRDILGVITINFSGANSNIKLEVGI